MALIAWRAEFETGIPDVDFEHRQLVELINGLHAEIEAGAGQQQVRVFLGEVFARIAAHFALEESVMRKHRYVAYAPHKAEHEELLDQIRDIMDEAEAQQSEAYRERLPGIVRDWFVNHFKSKDAQLHATLGI